MKKPIEVRGIQFPSLREAAKHFGAHYGNAVRRFNSGWPIEQALGLEAHKIKRPSKGKKVVTSAGEFASMTDAAEHFGVSVAVLNARLESGWSPDEAVGLILHKRRSKTINPVECEGKTFPNGWALAQAYGKKEKLVAKRLRLGWTPEQAVELAQRPPRYRDQYGNARGTVWREVEAVGDAQYPVTELGEYKLYLVTNQAFVDRFRYKASKARQAQSRLKMIAKLQPISLVAEEKGANISFPHPEPLAPPLITIDHVSVGYEPGKPILKNLDLRLDPDDRIALLGANGNGKSTFIKLLAGRLEPMSGTMRKSSKIRVGYFAQHQTDELDLEATPIEVMARAAPDLLPDKRRAHLGRFGLGQDQANTKVAQLSGGEELVTPNRAEMAQVVGAWSGEADLRARADALRVELGLGAVLVTRSEEGMSLFDAAGAPLNVPAQAREVFDVTGAGDTVIATMAVLVAAGATLREAVPLANKGGGIVVGRFGTASVTFDELMA